MYGPRSSHSPRMLPFSTTHPASPSEWSDGTATADAATSQAPVTGGAQRFPLSLPVGCRDGHSSAQHPHGRTGRPGRGRSGFLVTPTGSPYYGCAAFPAASCCRPSAHPPCSLAVSTMHGCRHATGKPAITKSPAVDDLVAGGQPGKPVDNVRRFRSDTIRKMRDSLFVFCIFSKWNPQLAKGAKRRTACHG